MLTVGRSVVGQPLALRSAGLEAAGEVAVSEARQARAAGPERLQRARPPSIPSLVAVSEARQARKESNDRHLHTLI